MAEPLRTERDLLESIIYPNASLVRSYEPMLVALHDGKTINGLIKSETPQEIVLVLDATKEAVIKRSDIDQMRPGTISIMPSGLEQQLTIQQLADVVAFLKAAK